MSVFQPKNMVEGGGLLDDVDAVIKEMRVVNWDYNGKVPVPVPALKATLEIDGVDGGHEQYWSMGKGTDWQPSEDGFSVVAVGKATGITRSSNAGILIESMVNAGFPENKVTDDVRCFEGLKAHWTRVSAPKRAGSAPKAPRADGRVFEDTILTVGSILSLPGEKKKATAPPKAAAGSSAPKTTAAPAPAAPVAADGDLDDRCTELVMEVLAENPNGVTKSQLPGLVFKKVGKDANKNKIVTRVFQEDFLTSGAWTYEGGKVSL